MTPGVTDFVYPGEELAALAHARRYYKWVLSYFRPHLGPTVIEVGPGIGTFSELLLREPIVKRLYLVEPAGNLVPVLQDRFAKDGRVRVLHGYLEDAGFEETAHAMVCVNVLEHVEDDVAFLLAARRVLAPGGRLLLFVPACRWLYGSLDRAFLHHRRYELRDLLAKMQKGGFEPVVIRYMNILGVLTWMLASRFLQRQTIRRFDVAIYDTLVVPWLSRLERLIAVPIGQSLLAVGRT